MSREKELRGGICDRPESRNKDDIFNAIKSLDTFTKNWCMNVEKTRRTQDLVFRCKECEFCDKQTGKCAIHQFAYNHKSNYPMGDFGSMGSH